MLKYRFELSAPEFGRNEVRWIAVASTKSHPALAAFQRRTTSAGSNRSRSSPALSVSDLPPLTFRSQRGRDSSATSADPIPGRRVQPTFDPFLHHTPYKTFQGIQSLQRKLVYLAICLIQGFTLEMDRLLP